MYIYIYILVGGFNPSEKKWKSVGMMKFPIYGNIKHVPNHQPNIIDWPLIDLDWCWSSYWPKGPDISILISPVARCDQRLRPSWMLTPNMIWKTRRIHISKNMKNRWQNRCPGKNSPKNQRVSDVRSGEFWSSTPSVSLSRRHPSITMGKLRR